MQKIIITIPYFFNKSISQLRIFPNQFAFLVKLKFSHYRQTKIKIFTFKFISKLKKNIPNVFMIYIKQKQSNSYINKTYRSIKPTSKKYNISDLMVRLIKIKNEG